VPWISTLITSSLLVKIDSAWNNDGADLLLKLLDTPRTYFGGAI
jgi:hypothetical protein